MTRFFVAFGLLQCWRLSLAILAATGAILSPASLCSVEIAQVGRVRVAISPPEVVDHGARWTYEGALTDFASGETVDLPAGKYEFRFKQVAGWVSPKPQHSVVFWRGEDIAVDLTATYTAVPRFAVGEIPPLTAWGEQTLSVVFHGGVLAQVELELTVQPSTQNELDELPSPQGDIAFNPETGQFDYSPHKSDRKDFTITISATASDGRRIEQTVRVSPQHQLPPEASVIDFVDAIPGDPKSKYFDRRYVLKNEEWIESEEFFNNRLYLCAEEDCDFDGIRDREEIESGESQDCNENGVPDDCDIADETSLDVDFNGIPDECNRGARPCGETIRAAECLKIVEISGKTLLFEAESESPLYKELNGREDIKELRLYAETVIIRDHLRLPQTTVSIYARTLEFQGLSDSVSPAGIDTTPRSEWLQPCGAVGAVGADGRSGHDAGDVRLYVERIAVLGSTEAKRFVLRGGNGQDAGKGRDGCDGRNAGFDGDPCDSNVPPITCDGSTLGGSWLLPPWDRRRPEGCSSDWFKIIRVKKESGECGRCGTDLQPKSGQDAIAGGLFGYFGEGGTLSHTLLGHDSTLRRMSDLSDGQSGIPAGSYKGGKAGEPRQWIKLKRDWHFSSLSCENEFWEVGCTRDGQDAPQPMQEERLPVRDGSFRVQQLGSESFMAWMHPYWLEHVVRHAKDAYLRGQIEFARSVFEEYLAILDSADLPSQFEDEFTALAGEMRSQLGKILGDLDFFGNPPGWVPSLSLEVEYSTFKDHVDSAVDILYTTAWIKEHWGRTQARTLTLENLKERLRTRRESLVDEYNRAMSLLPTLLDDAERIKGLIAERTEELAILEEELIAELDTPFWKKAFRIVGGVLKVIPYGQPALAAVGTGLDAVSRIDPDKSIVENAGTIVGGFSDVDFGGIKKKAVDFEESLAALLGSGATKERLAAVRALGRDLGKRAEEAKKAFDSLKLPRDAIDAELQKLKDADPRFNAVLARVEELNQEKQELAERISFVLSSVGTFGQKTLAITSDMADADTELAIRLDVLDYRAKRFIDRIEARTLERIVELKYRLIKAFQYRFLRQYKGTIDEVSLLVPLKDIALGCFEDVEDCSNPTKLFPSISPAQFDAMFDTVFFAGLSIDTDLVRDNREFTAGEASLELSAADLGELNDTGRVTVSITDKARFSPNHESVRITNVRTRGVQVTPIFCSPRQDPDEPPDCVPAEFESRAIIDLIYLHSGGSVLRREGQSFFCRLDEGVLWPSTYNGRTGEVSDHDPQSEQTEGLTRTILQSEGDHEALLLFGRPGGLGNMTIIRDRVDTDNGVQVRFDRLELGLTYAYIRKPDDMVVLDVVTPGGLGPLILVSRPDESRGAGQPGRQDGIGTFRRIYPVGSQVNLVAPEQYGVWRFDHWVLQLNDGRQLVKRGGSVRLPQDAGLRALDSNLEARAIYTQANTRVGEDVLVEPSRSVSVRFSEVTCSGETVVVEEQCELPAPDGFLPIPFEESLCYGVGTTAVYGDAEICITYDDTTLSLAEESRLELFKCTSEPPACEVVDFESIDIDSNKICARIAEFGTFFLAVNTNCDEDRDDDRWNDCEDNCPAIPNLFQSDRDDDDIGDACDSCPDDPENLCGKTNTQEGENIVVPLSSRVSVQFPKVTAAGVTTVVEGPCELENPMGFRVIPEEQPSCFEIETTAKFEGVVEICLRYDDEGLSVVDELRLEMFNCSGDMASCEALSDVRIDTDSNLICARTSHFSTFFLAVPRGLLLRGDTNSDGEFDVSDGIFVLLWLFSDAAQPQCLAAADANGSGQVDISDVSYVLSFLFTGGPPPVSPFPNCGLLGPGEELTCEVPPEVCR